MINSFLQKGDVRCLQIQLSTLREKFSLLSKNDDHKVEDDESLFEANKKLKKLCGQKLNPKLPQTLLNYLNANSLKLYFHLYVPFFERFQTKEELEDKTEKYCMWNNTSTKLSSTNTIRIKALISCLTKERKVIDTLLYVSFAADKMICCKFKGSVTRVSMQSGNEMSMISFDK